MTAAPRTVGKYRLHERIGAGGMASVHLGRLFATGGFRRIVAIKRLHPHLAEDASFVTGFLEEARLASRIHHPNVVAPLDVVAADGEVFLVFPHILGVSLATLLKQARSRGERVPRGVAVTMMSDVLRGLQAAHEAKGDDGEMLDLIHRDVSPHNVLVGKDGTAHLLDFGIAKAANRAQTTDEGMVKGKRGYMAPEHLRGNTERASDLYASCIVLWEMLAGRRLFDDESSLDDRLAGGPVPAPFAAGEEWPEMAALLARGLAFEPAARFGSARELARALEPLGGATAREVGEWVERVAADDLAERARLVEQAESASDEAPVAAPLVEPAVVVAAETAPPPRPRYLLLAVGLGVLLLAVGAAFLRPRAPPPTTLPAVDAALVVASPAVSVLPEPVVATTPAPPAPPATSASTLPKKVAPPAKAKRPCAPYVIDSRGHKQFNEDCLR